MTAPAAICPQCNNPLTPNTRFCNNCGQPIVLPATGATVAVAAASTIQLNKAGSNTQWQVGALIGDKQRYRVEKFLAKGGFGETYIATDLQLERQCVIKRMLVNLQWSPKEQQEALTNFVREAKLLAKLATPGHPNIPEIYEYLEAETCLVMKYIKGQNLDELRPRLQETKALAAIRDICNALVYMHGSQPPVLHRDIKPANILLGDDGRVWLIDFGLSKSTPVKTTALQGATMMAGTIGYTPAEQWQSAAVPQSDVYALAATLHTLLTDHVPPFTENDLPALILGTKGAFPPVRSLNPAVDQRVERLIQRSMDLDINKRPTAQEFLNELLQLAVINATITTPNGYTVTTPQELAQWCHGNWAVACKWLQGQLPDVIEKGFLNAQLAEKTRTIRDQYQHDINAALDFIIEQLDPATQRSCAIRITPNPINFGSLVVATKPVAKQITLANIGNRYVALQLSGKNWLHVNHPSSASNHGGVSLLPGMQQTFTVYACTEDQHFGGQIRAQLQIVSQNGLTELYPAQANLPRWKTFWATIIVPFVKAISSFLFGLIKGIFIFLFGFIGSIFESASANKKQSSHAKSAATRATKKKGSSLLGTVIVFFMIYSCFIISKNSYQTTPSSNRSLAQKSPQPVRSSATPQPAQAVTEPTPGTAPTLAVAGGQKAQISGVSTLNIRAEPNAESADVGDLYDTTIFELTGEERNGWLSVRSGTTEGWVNGKYVERLP